MARIKQIAIAKYKQIFRFYRWYVSLNEEICDLPETQTALVLSRKGIFVYFLTLQMCVYLCTKFNVFNIILNPDEPLKSAPRLGLRYILLFSASSSKSL